MNDLIKKMINSSYKIIQIPFFNDNYCHVLVDSVNKLVAAVDPADPWKVRQVVEEETEEKYNITSIWTTHKHSDHAGGNKYFRTQQIEMIGSIYEEGPFLNRKVSDGEIFLWGPNRVQVIRTPCHTRGHVCYFVTSPLKNISPVLFSGDTLFVGGCGRFFEGIASDMINSLKKLTSLPKETQIYCGHEYTKFALSVEPSNVNIKNKLKWARSRIESNYSTLPSTIQEELSYNPFLRLSSKEIQKSTKKTNPIEVMEKLREMKNNFK